MNTAQFPIEVEQELAPLSGNVEWVSEYGIGVGFDVPEKIDDAALEHLPTTIQWIVWVNLSQTRLTDSAVKFLATASRLEAIHLTGTAFTIAGVIELLESLPQIAEVHLASMPCITETDLQELAKRFPNVEFDEWME